MNQEGIYLYRHGTLEISPISSINCHQNAQLLPKWQIHQFYRTHKHLLEKCCFSRRLGNSRSRRKSASPLMNPIILGAVWVVRRGSKVAPANAELQLRVFQRKSAITRFCRICNKFQFFRNSKQMRWIMWKIAFLKI